MAFTVLHGALSDIGRKRPNNEDRYSIDTTVGLFVVCDGMGGGNAGEIASGLQVIHRRWLNSTGPSPSQDGQSNRMP